MNTDFSNKMDNAEAFEIAHQHLLILLERKRQNDELASLGLPSLEEMYQNCRHIRVKNFTR